MKIESTFCLIEVRKSREYKNLENLYKWKIMIYLPFLKKKNWSMMKGTLRYLIYFTKDFGWTLLPYTVVLETVENYPTLWINT